MYSAFLEDFDIETDGGHCFDRVAVGEGGEKGGFAGIFETDDDHVELLGEEDVEKFS